MSKRPAPDDARQDFRRLQRHLEALEYMPCTLRVYQAYCDGGSFCYDTTDSGMYVCEEAEDEDDSDSDE